MTPTPAEEEHLIEVGLVWEFFRRSKEGFFLDVGANAPKKGSQSWFLEQQGWRGILVEPQAALANQLRRERPGSRVCQVACGAPGHAKEMPLYIAEHASQSSLVKNLLGPGTRYVNTETVQIMTLDKILAEHDAQVLDFVSIDVEGTQLEVLKGFSLERYQPRLLLVEDHLYNLRVHKYLTKNHYRLVKRTGLNNWYVPKEMPFNQTNWMDRMRLWKKVWANTPFRIFRLSREQKRRKRQQSAHPSEHSVN